MLLKGLGKLKTFILSCLGPATFRLAAKCLKHYATANERKVTCLEWSGLGYLLESRERPVSRADNFTAIYEPIV
jgi:hypothetical protein